MNFELLACCAFAYDRGMQITVESEYIPRKIYQGDFPKVLPDFATTTIKPEPVKIEQKSQELLDFEQFEWQYASLPSVMVPLPSEWTYEYNQETGKLKAGEEAKIKLTLSSYKVNRSEYEGAKKALQKFGTAYEENNFPVSGEIQGAGAFLYQKHSFEGENMMLIAVTEREYKNELFVLFFVFRTESSSLLEHYWKQLYHIIKWTKVPLV